MSKLYKEKITLRFDTVDLKTAMIGFFKRFSTEVPGFLKEALSANGIEADPKVTIKKDGDELDFTQVNNDKGSVLVWTGENVTFTTYKLVPEGEPYVVYEAGQLIVYYKRTGADTRTASFPDFSMLVKALKEVQDPQKLIEQAVDQEVAEMKVVKDEEPTEAPA